MNLKFKVRYFRNPLENATPHKSGVGEKLLNQGLNIIKRKLKNPKLRLSVNRASKKVIHGFAYIYGYRYRSFLQDNFSNKNRELYYNNHECSVADWCKILSELNIQCKSIHKYKNLSSLMRSRYHNYIQIAHVDRYYHARRKFVRNARKRLFSLGDRKRYQFSGMFKRMGSKSGGQLTVLLTNIKNNSHLVTNHLWFNYTKGFRRLGYIKSNQVIYFKARVQPYRKGRLIKRYDFDLKYPTQIHF